MVRKIILGISVEQVGQILTHLLAEWTTVNNVNFLKLSTLINLNVASKSWVKFVSKSIIALNWCFDSQC